MRPAALAAAAALLGACSGNVGTLAISLTTAPGSTVLDGVQTLRLTITDPHTVTTAERNGDGFDIVLDLPATGAAGAVIVDGLDADGNLVATGASPPFPVGAIDARVVIYMAAPNSVGVAPLELDPARSELAGGSLSYGAILAGGRDAAGAPSDAVAIYNAYDHTFATGMAMPAPRAGLALGIGSGTAVYLFGGSDASGQPTASMWRFDTGVAPNGLYTDYGDKAGFARAGQLALPIGGDRFLISGAPPAVLSGIDGVATARTELASLPAAGATVLASDGVETTVFAGAGAGTGVARFRDDAFDTPDLPGAARTGDAVVALPGGKVGVVCGGAAFPDALRIDAATEVAETFPGVPATPRTGCAAAATSRYLVIAGGTLDSGEVSGSADIYDAATLAPVGTAQLAVPRTGALALPLPNGQILIAGGLDATGAPVATLELFTPAPDE